MTYSLRYAIKPPRSSNEGAGSVHPTPAEAPGTSLAVPIPLGHDTACLTPAEDPWELADSDDDIDVLSPVEVQTPSPPPESSAPTTPREQTVRERACRQKRIRTIRNGRLSYFPIRCGKPWCPECRDEVRQAWEFHLFNIWADLAQVWTGSFSLTGPTLSDDPAWVRLSARIAERRARYLRFPLTDGTQYVFADRDLATAEDADLFEPISVDAALGRFLALLSQVPPGPVMDSKPRGTRAWGLPKKSGGSRKIFDGVRQDEEDEVQQLAEDLILARYAKRVDLGLEGDATGIPDAEVIAIGNEALAIVRERRQTHW